MEKMNEEIKKINLDGIEVEFDQNLLDNVDVLEMIDQIEDGKAQKIVPLFKALFGEDVYAKIRADQIAKNGVFKASKLSEFYEQIFASISPKD